MAPRTRRPYKDFLQPTLQRRFASTALVALAISYLESVFLSSWDSIFWSLFPLSSVGLRGLCLFTCALLIITLRIANPHLGVRATSSPAATLIQCCRSFASLETVLTYALSAFVYGMITRAAMPEKANLKWVNQLPGDRARLNERAVFYTATLVMVGITEGVVHLYKDYDSLQLSIVNPESKKENQEKQEKPDKKEQPQDAMEKLFRSIPQLAVRSLTTAGCVNIASYLVIYRMIRPWTWRYTLFFFRAFHTLPRSNLPPTAQVWSVWTLLRTTAASFMLLLLWHFSNEAMTLRLKKEPLKNGQPLTAESKDPNGSLLTGIKNKTKPRITAFAMWELALIARDFETRRKSLFDDIERLEGTVWSQIYTACTDLLRELEQRVDNYLNPAPPPSFPDDNPKHPPQRVVEPPAAAAVLAPVTAPTNFRESIGKLTSQYAQKPGKHPDDTLGPLAREAWDKSKQTAAEFLAQHNILPKDRAPTTTVTVSALARVPWMAWIFTPTHQRRLCAVLLGSPHADGSVYANAAFAVSELAVRSLDEDRYGNVARDVAALVRRLTSVVKKIDLLAEGGLLAMEGLDAGDGRGARGVDADGEGQVGMVRLALRTALKRVLVGFEPYAGDLRLSAVEIRAARELVGGVEEEVVEVEVERGRERGRGMGMEKVQRGTERGPEMMQVR